MPELETDLTDEICESIYGSQKLKRRDLVSHHWRRLVNACGENPRLAVEVFQQWVYDHNKED